MILVENVNNCLELLKIKTQNLPNQSFDCYLNNILFNFKIRTYHSGRSTITIYKNEILVCNEAPFLVNVNFLTFSDIENEAIFFLTANNQKSYNFENLGKEINLFYAVYDNKILRDEEKNYFYNDNEDDFQDNTNKDKFNNYFGFTIENGNFSNEANFRDEFEIQKNTNLQKG